MVTSGGEISRYFISLVKLPAFVVTTFTRKTSGIGGCVRGVMDRALAT